MDVRGEFGGRQEQVRGEFKVGVGQWNEKGHSEVDERSVECARRV